MIRVFHKLDDLAIMLILVSEACIPVGCVPPACWPYPSMHCAEGVSAWGVSAQRRCLPRGVSARVVCVADTPCEQNDWQTGVKTLPCRNFVAGGSVKSNALFSELIWHLLMRLKLQAPYLVCFMLCLFIDVQKLVGAWRDIQRSPK